LLPLGIGIVLSSNSLFWCWANNFAIYYLISKYLIGGKISGGEFSNLVSCGKIVLTGKLLTGKLCCCKTPWGTTFWHFKST
jgi:hypothetical protein